MTVADGKVFVSDVDGIQAYDAAGSKNCSGTPKTCSPLWDTSINISTGPGFVPGTGAPVVANGVLYVPGGGGSSLSTGEAAVAAFDPAGVKSCTGSVHHRHGGSAFSATGSAGCSGSPKVCAPLRTVKITPLTTPVVADGNVYVNSSSGLDAFDAAGSQNCPGTAAA